MIPFKNDEIASNLEIYHDTIVTWAYKSHIYIAGFKKYASRTGIASFDIMNTGTWEYCIIPCFASIGSQSIS